MLNDTPEWQALAAHQKALAETSLQTLFDQDKERFEHFHLTLDGLLFDYSKHHVTQDTIHHLCDLARARDIEGFRDRMFAGDILNESEGRAVLHPALRGSCDGAITIDGENVTDFVRETLAQIKRISDDIRGNSSITDVVNIGIGGSDLGPRIACEALSHYTDGPQVHFVANVDGHRMDTLMKRLNPANTVFIVTSKTFTTQETLMNAQTARAWLVDALGSDAVGKHFYAVSTNEDAVSDFGIQIENMLPMRDWVGGRFSVWGAVGLPLAIAIGPNRFQDFLDGAKAVDTHFCTAPLEENVPVLMALLGVWYTNFWAYDAHAVIPYAQSMMNFSRYLQQLEMESNGKSVCTNGKKAGYKTAPITFGEPGTNAQHAFFQLLHQGSQIVPIDFITFINPAHDLTEHHTVLLANALAQSQAFMRGDAKPDNPQHHFEGNRPSSMLMFERLDPYHLGMLLALYEHKTAVQGALWGINSFDQWGVELGKKLARDIESSLSEDGVLVDADSSTQNLIRHILQKSV